MVKSELVHQIKAQLRFGTSKESLLASLKANGHSEQDIQDSFIAAYEERKAAPAFASDPSMPAAAENPSVTDPGNGSGFVDPDSPEVLPSFRAKEILDKSWTLYKSHWKTFLGIVLLPAVLDLFLAFVLSAAGPGSGIALAILAVLFLVQIWASAALVYAIRYVSENITVSDAFRRSRTKLPEFVLVSLLVSAIVVGGMAFLFIPGIILSVWFSFVYFVIVDEDLRGMDALLKSREYVRGRFWDLIVVSFMMGIYLIIPAIGIGFASLILAGLIYAICSALGIADAEFFSEEGNLNYGANLSFVLTPVITIFSYYVYRIFKRDRGEFVFAPTDSTKTKYVLLGVVGVLVIIALIGIILSIGAQVPAGNVPAGSRLS